jgi:hypothetical protein
MLKKKKKIVWIFGAAGDWRRYRVQFLKVTKAGTCTAP